MLIKPLHLHQLINQQPAQANLRQQVLLHHHHNMSNSKKLRIVSFSGSLREASANSGLVRAAAALAKAIPDVEFEDVTELVGKLPLYDTDLETEKGFDGAVKRFREALRSADAILIATPEYNYSIPGTLKNALDWVSRPDDATYSSFPTNDKVVGLMGAGGVMGTSRAQHHLRQVGVFLNWHFVNRPEVHVNLWGGKQITNDEGDIIEQGVQDQVKALLEALIALTKRLNSDKFGSGKGSLSEWTRDELKSALKEKRKQAKLERKKARPE